MPTAFHKLQFGKGNKTADWVACGDSRSSLCCPCETAASSPASGWLPAEWLVSGSPRCPFLLKWNERFFHTRRVTSLNEVALLVFDRQFDLSNLSYARGRLGLWALRVSRLRQVAGLLSSSLRRVSLLDRGELIFAAINRGIAKLLSEPVVTTAVGGVMGGGTIVTAVGKRPSRFTTQSKRTPEFPAFRKLMRGRVPAAQRWMLSRRLSVLSGMRRPATLSDLSHRRSVQRRIKPEWQYRRSIQRVNTNSP